VTVDPDIEVDLVADEDVETDEALRS